MLKICPRCGATSEKKKFVGSFCEDCFAGQVKIAIPRTIPVTICRTCGRIRTDKWEKLTNKSLEKPVRKEIEGKFDNVRFIFPDSAQGTASAVFLVRAGDMFVEIPRQFELVHKFTLCEDCSRASSGYFEAILQLRGDPQKVEKKCAFFIKELGKHTFMPRIEEQKHGGIDIYVGSNKEVIALLQTLGIRAEISHTLHGVKDGARIYRVTYCIRL